MRNLFKKITTTVAALAVVVGATQLVHGATNVVVTGGGLSMDPVTVNDFTGVTLDGTVQTTTATINNFNIVDSSGTGNGWNLVVTATQLQNAGVTRTLPQSSIVMAAPTLTAGAGSSAEGTVTTASGVIDDGVGTKILSAAVGGGMGTYTVSYPANALTLTLNPKDTYADTYTTTLTFNLTTGP